MFASPTSGRGHTRGGAGRAQSGPWEPWKPPQVVVAGVKGAHRSSRSLVLGFGGGSCLAGDLGPHREETGG